MNSVHNLDVELAKGILESLEKLNEGWTCVDQTELSTMIAGFEIIANGYQTRWSKAAYRNWLDDPTESNWEMYESLKSWADKMADKALHAFSNNYRKLWGEN